MPIIKSEHDCPDGSRIHDYLETSQFIMTSEKAFPEWENPREDIYNVGA